MSSEIRSARPLRRAFVRLSITYALFVALTAVASAQDYSGAPRERPLPDDQLLDFMDAADQGAALARRCPDAFSQADAATLALAQRWGRSVSQLPAYDVRLALTALSVGAERAQAVAAIDCAAASTATYADSFRGFIDAAPQTVRRSEIR